MLSAVKLPELVPASAPPVALRRARFEDVAGILRLIERAIEHGCRKHYDERQRRSVYLGYASSLFLEALGPYLTLVLEIEGRLAGTAQVDPASGLLRALFVDAGLQGRGMGRSLLASVEERVRAAGSRRLFGAMSLNAVSFYRGAGFRPCDGPERVRGLLAWVPVMWMAKPLSG